MHAGDMLFIIHISAPSNVFLEICRNRLILLLFPAPFLHALASMLAFLKLKKKYFRSKNKTNEVLLDTGNAFMLLISSVLHLSHVPSVSNLPLQQKGGFCIWNTVFYLFMASQAAYQRKSGLFLHSRWNVMILEKYGTNLSEEKALN